MGAGRIIVGTLFCLIAAILIVFFVTLRYTAADYSELGNTAQYAVIFTILLNPIAAINVKMVSVLAALAVGALIGGLISKSPIGGLLVGVLSFIVIFIVFLSFTVGFDINAWMTWVNEHGSNVVLDLLACVAILAVFGAIGGKLTAESD